MFDNMIEKVKVTVKKEIDSVLVQYDQTRSDLYKADFDAKKYK